MARLLITAGLILVAAGLLVAGLGRLGWPVGRLPGDLSYRGRHFAVFAPLGTCLVLSVLLSLVLYVLGRMRH